MSTQQPHTWNLTDTQAAVIQLGARYCAYVDATELANIVGLFAADGAITVNGVAHRGRNELTEFFSKAAHGIHLSGVPFVTEVDEDHVESIQNFLFVADGDSVLKRGTYRDRLLRDGHEFVFEHRQVDMHPTG